MSTIKKRALDSADRAIDEARSIVASQVYIPKNLRQYDTRTQSSGQGGNRSKN